MKKKNSRGKSKLTYFLSDSQRKKSGRKSLLFGSKRVMMVTAILILVSGLAGVAILQQSQKSKAATPESYSGNGSGPSLSYSDDATTALLNGRTQNLVTDIRGSGSINKVAGGVNYTSNSGAERSEHAIGAATKPLWSDNSSGWFAFDFTVNDLDSSWRVIEQEHEGDMSPSRSLEAGGSTLKLASRYGTPDVDGPDKTWNITTIVPGKRIQIVGYEKFGQGDAIMQAWWRPYGTSSWTQFASSTNFSMGYTSGNPGRYHKRGTYHGNHSEQSSVTWYGTSVMFGSLAAAKSGAGMSDPTTSPPSPTPTPTPTPSPTPAPAPSPTPSPTPVPVSTLPPSNKWTSWVYSSKNDGGSVMTHANSTNLLVQFDGGKTGYLPLQWGHYCMSVPTSYAVPKYINFSATYNPNGFNNVYFYSGGSSNKLWNVSNVSGVSTTKSYKISLQGKRLICFGNEAKSNVGINFPANRYLKINSYSFSQ